MLKSLGFDPERSGVQALKTLIETVQVARKAQKKVGAVFFDFTDAFGNVDRKILLTKLKQDFGIRANCSTIWQTF